jgi:sugar phosphate permease
MAVTATAADIAAAAKTGKTRYAILLLIFIVTTINYADRATLSITGPAMRAEFGFDAIQMGIVFSAFSWAYVLAQVLLDRFVGVNALATVFCYLVIVKDIRRVELQPA